MKMHITNVATSHEMRSANDEMHIAIPPHLEVRVVLVHVVTAARHAAVPAPIRECIRPCPFANAFAHSGRDTRQNCDGTSTHAQRAKRERP